MRIAFLAGGVFPTLSKTFIINQITALIDEGHEVDIYARSPGNESKTHPAVVRYQLGRRTYYDRLSEVGWVRSLQTPGLLLKHGHKQPLAVFRALNGKKYGRAANSLRLLHLAIPYLGKQPYDIVHCHFGNNGIKSLAVRQLGLLQGKLIVTFHGGDLTKDIQEKGDRIYDELFQQGDLFLPISEHWREKLIELGCPPEKIRVHRMGIDCRSFAPIERSPVKQAVATSSSYCPSSQRKQPLKLISVCRLTEKKGLEYSIRAVARLAAKYYPVEYSIIGDGELKTQLQQLIDSLNLNHRIKLIGWQEKSAVIALLQAADVLLAPSVTAQNGDREGIPVALMEAMAMGLPVLSTIHSGIPELVEDGVSGFLVAEKDIEGLVEKLKRLSNYPLSRQQMGLAGARKVRESYNIDLLNSQLMKIYQEVLAS